MLRIQAVGESQVRIQDTLSDYGHMKIIKWLQQNEKSRHDFRSKVSVLIFQKKRRHPMPCTELPVLLLPVVMVAQHG